MIILPERLPRYSNFGESYTQYFKSPAMDLSSLSVDLVAYHSYVATTLSGYTIVYEEASSSDTGVSIRVGRLTSAGSYDNDYFDIVTSEVSKAQGYAKTYITASLTNTAIAAGMNVTVNTTGGKTGAGVVSITLHISIPRG